MLFAALSNDYFPHSKGNALSSYLGILLEKAFEGFNFYGVKILRLFIKRSAQLMDKLCCG